MFGYYYKNSDNDKSPDSCNEDEDSVAQPSAGESVLNLEAIDWLLGETMLALNTLKQALESGSIKDAQAYDKEMFELSCYKAAIEQYHVIDFGQGSKKYISHKQKNCVMTKQVMSCFLPE